MKRRHHLHSLEKYHGGAVGLFQSTTEVPGADLTTKYITRTSYLHDHDNQCPQSATLNPVWNAPHPTWFYLIMTLSHIEIYANEKADLYVGNLVM